MFLVVSSNKSSPPISRYFYYNFSMNRLLPVLIVFGAFLASTGTSLALPKCPGSFYENSWTNCFGTFAHANGNKYFGEFKDDDGADREDKVEEGNLPEFGLSGLR